MMMRPDLVPRLHVRLFFPKQAHLTWHVHVCGHYQGSHGPLLEDA
jgi:hypothetical protein